MKETDLAWAAGFIDGEGYVGITRAKYKHKRDGFHYNYRIEINVGHTKLEMMHVLKDLFGGQISTHNDEFGLKWAWTVYCDAAAVAAKLLLPYLKLKRRQAEIILQFHTTRTTAHRDSKHRFALLHGGLRELRESLHAQAMELNKRRVRAERLNEEAPAMPDDAIVRSDGNKNRQSSEETQNRLIQ